MSSVFSEQILADKLSKLNSTQQCVETLSHWCIFHQSKAAQVVTTWDKQFHSSEMAQKVPLLYLANDILQNSKRKGKEFVTEFWMVLPAALKDIIENGDDAGKNVVSRLVNIWEERRVFGSRGKRLCDVMLGKDPPSPLELNRKRSRTIRIIKRDSRSIRTKLSIGGTAEKIVSAYHSVLSEYPVEEAEMNKCKSAIKRVRKMEKDVDIASKNSKDPSRKNLDKGLEEEENIIQHCVEKLKSVEANREALVAELREALHEQESELENVRTQLQVAQAQVGEAGSMRKRLNGESYAADANEDHSGQKPRSAAALAAEVADKLTASSSSQFIMSSVLSTFAAEEAKNAGLTKNSVNPASRPVLAMASPVSSNLQLVSNPSSQLYTQQPNPFCYVSIPPLPPGPPRPPLQSHLMAPMASLNQQPPMSLTQSQPLQQSQPPPAGFRPLQLPAMLYYNQSRHSQ